MSIAGRYRHIVKLGEGTYGAVYQATERDTGRIIAFKRMMSSSDDEGVPGTAIREICLFKELKHDNIVTMYEVLFEQPKITLIFELCDCDLKKFLDGQENGKMDPQTEIGPVLKQMFLGLQYLHSHGVVHRDLKPQNIFLNIRPRHRTCFGKSDVGGAVSHGNGHHHSTPGERVDGALKSSYPQRGTPQVGGSSTTIISRVNSTTGSARGAPPPRVSGEYAQTSKGRTECSVMAGNSSDRRDSKSSSCGGGAHHLSIKLGDFGLARVDSIPVKKYSHEVVTLWYRSPDATMGSALYSFPVDIWSMGAIFFEIVTGKVLFCGRNEEEQLFRMFFLLGSPTHETWPSMLAYPKARTRLEGVAALATQLHYAATTDDSKSCKDSHNHSSHNRSCSQDIFFDFFKKHLTESMANDRYFHDSTTGTEYPNNLGTFPRTKVNSYQLPAELWFPNPMLDVFLTETGFRDAVGEDGVHLLWLTLEYEPSRRITCNAALQHPFLSNVRFSSEGILEQLERELVNSLKVAGL